MIHFLIGIHFTWLEVIWTATVVFFVVDIGERRACRLRHEVRPPTRWVDVIEPRDYFGGTVRIVDTDLDPGLE